jgi:hypothetical protein
MANNLLAGNNGFYCKQSVLFADAGFNATNTLAIFKIGNPSESWNPAPGSLNTIEGFEEGKSYYVIMKSDIDASAYGIPPLDGEVIPPPSGATLLWEDNFNGPDVGEISGRTTSTGAKIWEKWIADTGGAVGIISNEAGIVIASGTGVGPFRYYVNLTSGRNIDLRVTLGANPDNQQYPFGYAILGFSDADNCFLFELRNSSVTKRVAGVNTQIYAGTGATNSNATGDVVRAVLNGTSLAIYKNATLLTTLTVSATEIAGTAAGIWMDGGGAATSRINSIAVYSV